MNVSPTPHLRGCLLLEARPELRSQPPIELGEGLQSILQRESLHEISRLKVSQAGQEAELMQFFNIRWDAEGDASADLCWSGDCSSVHGIGRGWREGTLEIRGSAGDCVGEQMSGGQIRVSGNAGDALGRGMSGGRITIAGNAGDGVGGPCPRTLKGMTGGEIFLRGSAGKNLGERMRRGTIFVGQSTEEGVGREMLAGTIVLAQTPQTPVGIGMKRGTVLMLDTSASSTYSPGPLFDAAVDYEPTFVRVLLRYLAQTADLPEAEAMLESTYRRHSGDMLQGGRGEILVRLPTPEIASKTA